MSDGPPYDDPFDAAEAVTERTAARWTERFARFFQVSPSGVWVKVWFPLAMLAAGAILVTALFWDLKFRLWTFITVYFAPFGIETGIPAGTLLGIPPLLMVAIVIYVDLFGGLFLVWNIEHLLRVPRIGPWLQRIERKSAEAWAKRRRLRDLGVVGLGIFVMLPISGSGAVPGAIIGRIGGFPWGLVWLAIFLGSSIRVIFYTLAVISVRDLFF